MNTDDHTTRTLLLSQKVPGTLLISRGSTENIDLEAATLSSGHSQIRAFDLNNLTNNAYDYDTDGLRIGWGLRNSVGVAEHPTTGGLYSVENSVDQMMRDGVDIHQDNPGEEMNFHGTPVVSPSLTIGGDLMSRVSEWHHVLGARLKLRISVLLRRLGGCRHS
jgi:glucose/arabinose dehydrogenase